MTRTILALSLVLAAGCASSETSADAVATLSPLANSGVEGTVEFTLMANGQIRIDAEISGLTPGKHAMHVHEWGDCSAPDGTSAGGHFNPDTVDHGAPEAMTHHPGDFGNLEADADGHATYGLVTTTQTLSLTAHDKYNVLGRAIIVHEKLDDFGQPTGNAGVRLACGVIHVAGGTTAPVKNPNPGS